MKYLMWIKTNWFKLIVVVLLLMIYVRLGEINETTFYSADMVDSSATRIITSLDDRLKSIDDGIDAIRRSR